MRALLALLTARLRRRMPEQPWSGLTVILTGDTGMRRWNAAVFGRDRTTDVISIAYPPLPGEDGFAGEVVVNAACAARLGPQFRGWSPGRELALYVAHGFDHLSGADDDSPSRRRRMRRRELDWLRQARTSGIDLDSLLAAPVRTGAAPRRA